MPDIIDFKNVTTMRGMTKALDRITLKIARSQSTAIIGPNGSGKSSLLKLISRELYPTLDPDSSLMLMGRKRWNVWELRKSIGIVSLDFQQKYTPTVLARDVVLSGFASTIGHVDVQEFSDDQIRTTDRLIDELGIGPYQHKPLRKLSTGEKRRCLMARALVNNPEVLVFDEPTIGLDIGAIFQYLETAARLIEQGHTVIQVTHNIHEIPPQIQHVVLLERGKVLVAGNKQDVLTGENLSRLFDASIEVVCENGFYRALPGGKS